MSTTTIKPPVKPRRGSTARKPVRPAVRPGNFDKRTISVPQMLGKLVWLGSEIDSLLRIWVRADIDPTLREEMMVAVARSNRALFCTWAHSEWARVTGASSEDLDNIEKLERKGFDARTWAAIRYVRALAEEEFGPVAKPLVTEMRKHYSEQEISDIELVAKVMDLGNRGSNTTNALFWRLRGKPAAHSDVVSEVVLGGLLVAAAPPILAYLSLTGKRSFLGMARDLVSYVSSKDSADFAAVTAAR
jgi:AhpD family alkylhydroperoxidase